MLLLSIWSSILHWIDITSMSGSEIITSILVWVFGGMLYILIGFIIFQSAIHNTYLRCIVFLLWPLCVAILIIGIPFICLYQCCTERG